MARIALSTSCGPEEQSLQATVESFAELGVGAVALHRHPRRARFRVPVVAVFGDGSGSLGGAPLLVVDAPEGPLEDLCRWLHGLQAPAVALRTSRTPEEIVLVREDLPRIGYWHDVARGGEEFLEVADPAGASFDPLETADLARIRAALSQRAPAVVELPAGSEQERIVESLACAHGVFGA